MKYKYKVCVYAICKNEEKFVDRWYESVKEADEIYVLDTGSTDNTVNKLMQHGVFVTKKIIDPWRFDVARNESLKLVPDDTDICVCVDLDEVYEPGWRKLLENCWKIIQLDCDIHIIGKLSRENLLLPFIMRKLMLDMVMNGFIQSMKF